MANNATVSGSFQAIVVCLDATGGGAARDARASSSGLVKSQIGREVTSVRERLH